MMYDNDTFEVEERTFKVRFPVDDMQELPWVREDGHGPVSDWTTRAKRPGELVLCQDRSYRRYYDLQEAVRRARKEGWRPSVVPDAQAGPGLLAALAAQEDYKRLRRWCDGRWEYVGVEVELVGAKGEDDALWGIESDCDAYLEEVARELAGGILHRMWSRNPCGL